MFGRERGERLWRFAGGTADFVLDLVARHRPRLQRAARHLDPGHPLGKSGGDARGSAWTIGQSAARRCEYLDRARVAATAAAPTSTSADSRTTGHGSVAAVVLRARVGCAWRSAAGARVRLPARAWSSSMPDSLWLARRHRDWSDGTVADTVLVATNAPADGIVPGLARSIVALTSLQIATAPLPPSLRQSAAPRTAKRSPTRAG